MLDESALPPLGFARSGNNNHTVSDQQFSDAIRGFVATADSYTNTGILLPGCPSRERERHEGIIAQRGWFRDFPTWETVCLKHAKPGAEDDGVKRIRGRDTPKPAVSNTGVSLPPGFVAPSLRVDQVAAVVKAPRAVVSVRIP